jgi:hypothetical protein
MTWHRTEEEVDKMIGEMKSRSKGKYITQGVSFNKSCPRQMGMLKKALMYSSSFSGLAKELLAIRFSDSQAQMIPNTAQNPMDRVSKAKDIGNFI